MYLPLQRKKNCVKEFMQTAKEYTRKILLKTARETFLRKGFKATSMREISKLSGVGLSNIYNYYSCKDDLLAAILHPLFEAMDTMLENHNRPEFVSIEVFTSEECHRAYVHNFIDIVICTGKSVNCCSSSRRIPDTKIIGNVG